MILNEQSLTTAELIKELGLRFREYRMRLDLTRQEVADMSAVGLTTLYKFETGQMTDMSFVTLMKLLRTVGLQQNWHHLLPELPESPYMFNNNKKRQRVRHVKP